MSKSSLKLIVTVQGERITCDTSQSHERVLYICRSYRKLQSTYCGQVFRAFYMKLRTLNFIQRPAETDIIGKLFWYDTSANEDESLGRREKIGWRRLVSRLFQQPK